MQCFNIRSSFFTLSKQGLRFATLTMLLTACASSGPDIPMAKESGQPILVTNLDTYLANPYLLKVSDKVKLEAIEENSAYKEKTQKTAEKVDDKLVSTQEVAAGLPQEVVGLFIRFINLQDQTIEKIEFTFKAYDDQQDLIQLAEDDGMVEMPASSNAKGDIEEVKGAESQEVVGSSEQKGVVNTQNVFTAEIDVDENILLITMQEVIKPDAFNALNHGSLMGASANVAIHCVNLEKVSVTTADGNTQSYAASDLVSSSQIPRCEPSSVD